MIDWISFRLIIKIVHCVVEVNTLSELAVNDLLSLGMSQHNCAKVIQHSIYAASALVAA